MTHPAVSIIVPTYNQGQYLSACLDSIWFQDYPDLEIIVVNDGSTDSTEAVLDAYQHAVANDRTSFASRYNETTDAIERTYHPRYPKEGRRLHIIRHEGNRGLAPALNTGFSAATGVFCTYVPSDDICYPHMISSFVEVLEEHHSDFAFSDMLIHDAQGRIIRRFSLPEYSFKSNFADWYLCGVSKLYKRDLHDRFGMYDETLLAHDHELFQRFALGGARFVHVPKTLMSLLSHDGPREVDIHSPSNWSRLLRESRQIVLDARQSPLAHDPNVKR